MTDIKTKLYHKTRHVSKFLTSSPNHKSKRQFLWCKCSSGACAVFTFSSWCISMCVCVCVFVCVCDFCLCASLCSLVCLCLILMTADAAREPRKWSRDRSVRWKTSFIYLVKLKVNTQKKRSKRPAHRGACYSRYDRRSGHVMKWGKKVSRICFPIIHLVTDRQTDRVPRRGSNLYS